MDGFALLLQANADIGTLWNIRREVVLVLSKLLEDGDDKGQVDEAVMQANVVERDALFRKEVIYIHGTTIPFKQTIHMSWLSQTGWPDADLLDHLPQVLWGLAPSRVGPWPHDQVGDKLKFWVLSFLTSGQTGRGSWRWRQSFFPWTSGTSTAGITGCDGNDDWDHLFVTYLNVNDDCSVIHDCGGDGDCDDNEDWRF